MIKKMLKIKKVTNSVMGQAECHKEELEFTQ